MTGLLCSRPAWGRIRFQTCCFTWTCGQESSASSREIAPPRSCFFTGALSSCWTLTYAWVRLYDGKRFVLATSKEEVIPTLPHFASYKPFPFIILPPSTFPSCRQSTVLTSSCRRARNDMTRSACHTPWRHIKEIVTSYFWLRNLGAGSTRSKRLYVGNRCVSSKKKKMKLPPFA